MVQRRASSHKYLALLFVASTIVLITHLGWGSKATTEDDLTDPLDIDNSPPSSADARKSWRMSMEWSNSLFNHLWQDNQRGSNAKLPLCEPVYLPAPPAPAPAVIPAAVPQHHVAQADDEDDLQKAHTPAHHDTSVKTPIPPRNKAFQPNGETGGLLPTKLLKHAPGWTLYENVYMAGGTFFVVTDDKSSWPELRMMVSVPLIAENNPENIAAREPTDQVMQFVSTTDAKRRWADRVWPVEGLTLFTNDPPQFLNHYYHFAAETFLGMWRMYSSMDSDINVKGETTLEAPSRFIFAHLDSHEWRDYSKFNQFIMHGAFPSMGIEISRDWEGRSAITDSDTGAEKVWRFDKLLLADRSSSFRGEWAPGRNQRIAAEAWVATREESSKWWWEPVRRAVLRFAGVEQKVIDLPVQWAKEWNSVSNGDVKPTDKEIEVAKTASKKMPIVITYIVRSGNRRSLIPEDHKLLVSSLRQLCDAKGWELNVAHAERMTREEQVNLAARTTVMLGIHGNGLTHLIWMPLTPLSTVIEIFIPNGFAKDYEWTSRALGMRHYAVWNDTYATHPNEPRVDYPEGFQGDQIPVYGPAVAKLIEDRVEGRLP